MQTLLCVTVDPGTDPTAVESALRAQGFLVTRAAPRQSTTVAADGRVLLAGADLAAFAAEYRADPRPTLVVAPSAESEAAVLAMLRRNDDVWCARGTTASLDLRLRRVLGGTPPHHEDFYGSLEAWTAALSPALEAAVLAVDLDHFLPINERYGIAGGNAVLDEAMRRINQTLEPQDRVTRREGDDIYVLLAREDKASVIAAAATARECIGAAPIVLSQDLVTVTASAGLAFVQGRGASRAAHQAWLATYMAKDAGRNDLVLYDSLRDGSEDALTGAHSRRYFDARFRRELSRAIKGSEPLTLALLDLDDFGQVNKRYGHTVGDDVLRQFVAVVMASVRPSDWLARYGGEEFCLVMRAKIADAYDVAERIREAVAASTFESAGHALRMTVSIGLMPAGADPSTVTDIIQGASVASRDAKDAGKNRVAIAG